MGYAPAKHAKNAGDGETTDLNGFSQRRQHHHPSKHRVLVSGPLTEATIVALLDRHLLIAAV